MGVNPLFKIAAVGDSGFNNSPGVKANSGREEQAFLTIWWGLVLVLFLMVPHI